MKTSKTIGIWIRVSTQDQARGESPEHHEKRARLYAEAKGWAVKEVYHLEAVSGKAVMEHPEAKRMLTDIKEGNISGIIFSKLARLARNTRELLDFADYFRDYNADLISLQEAIDTSSPAGRLFFTIISAMAQWEREEIAERVSASVPIRAKLGKPLGGQAPYGYSWKNKELVINEKEAPIRKLMYEIFLKTKRKKTTATELNNLGYRTRNGSKFSDTTVGRLLSDTTAKGQRIANYTSSKGDGKAWKYKPQEEWVVTPCPAIVSEEVWNECNAILQEQAKQRRTSSKKANYLLTGMLKCEKGHTMYVFGNKNIYQCTKCKNRIPITDIDEIYHAQLKQFLLTEVSVDEYRKQTEETLLEKESLFKSLSQNIKTNRAKMDNLVTMRINGEFTKDNFIKHYQPLEVQTAQLEEQQLELQSQIDMLKVHSTSSEMVLSEAKNLYEQWEQLEFTIKRNIVEAITESIVIGKEDIHIKLAHIPTDPTSLNTVNEQHNFKDS